MTTSFRVGRGIGIVYDATLVVIEPINGALAESLWALVNSGAGIDELLEELSSTGLRALGSFAMAQFEEGQTRVVVRGSAAVTVDSPEGPRRITALGVRTWVEEVVDGVVAAELALDGASVVEAALPFRVERGLLPADVLRQGTVVAPGLSGVALDWVDDFDAVTVLIVDPAGPDSAETDLSTMAPAEQAVETRSAPPDPGRTMTAADLSEVTQASTVDVGSLAHDDESPVTAQHPVVSAVDEPVAGAGDEYDEIYGRTMARSVHSAAVHSVPDEAEAAPEPSPAVTGGLIQGIPAAPAEVLGDHDGRTMTKAQILAMKAAQSGQQASAPASTMGGPTVQALVCPSQHANPPQLSVCRVCAAALNTPPVHIARPILGSLRFSNGSRVPLDRPVLIGRNPKVEGGLAGEIPQVVRLDVGPGLSRTHASVRLEGWQVLLEDLNSANGTIVRLPGREPRRLHPGEPILLEIGSDVDFGGEISCVFEAQ